MRRLEQNDPIFPTTFISACLCIILELLYTQLLNLKSWNHIVYTVIPFAMLGCGIGANAVFLFNKTLRKFEMHQVMMLSLLSAVFLSFLTAFLLKNLPLRLDYLATIFVSVKSIGALLLAYVIFMLPFVAIGFLITFIFVNNPKNCNKLYFFDLAGAGAGAALFYFLINSFAVFHSLALIGFAVFIFINHQLKNGRKWIYLIFSCIIFFYAFKLPEPINYAVDREKSWEWIPGFFKAQNYDHIFSKWHSLGRTDIFRIKTKEARREISERLASGSVAINLDPRPEFSYFTTNFLAGTPAYELSREGLRKNHSEVKLFTTVMESAYVLLKKPRVVVIGAGGGRDIFMARTHGAQDILGAEVNPATASAMSPGGALYEYTGRIYTEANTRIFNIDGRHLVKTIPSKSKNLVILNGVDTFSGLSSGAYAYAESYLYTSEAVEDYLRILDDGGILYICRYSFLPEPPREELRLFGIILHALKSVDARYPADHIIVGWNGLSSILVKKTPFTLEERRLISDHFVKLGVLMVYPVEEQAKPHFPLYAYFFDRYAHFYKENTLPSALKSYPYDISVVTDDSPFFYKYYKINSLNLFQPQIWHHTGNIPFLTQILILIQACLFICLFIVVPLFFSRLKFTGLPAVRLVCFVLYVACIGIGYMFVEISMMQRFVLLLGSPIYSIGIVLMALLLASGLGSLLKPRLGLNTILFLLFLAAIIFIYPFAIETLIRLPFLVRALAVVGMVLPLGVVLGAFFPAILNLGGRVNEHMIAWAWGINCGFSVMGSILAIVFAQFIGFNMVLAMAGFLYVCAFFLIRNLVRRAV